MTLWPNAVARPLCSSLRVSSLARGSAKLCTLSLLLTAFALSFGCGTGATQVQSSHPAAPVAVQAESVGPEKQRTPGLFLYEIAGPHDTVTHLLGTMHVGFGFDEVLTEDAQRRFQAAARVLLEADVTAADPNQMRERALLPAGQSLRKLLGEPSWKVLVERLGPQIPPPFMERMKPWLPAVTLGLMDLDVALREIKPEGRARMMDVEVMTRARAEKKPLVFLETVDEQLAMFDRVPLEEQIGELRRTLLEGASAQGKVMLRAFADGDEQALTTSLFAPEQLADAPGFFDVVLHQRNERWMPVLEREVERGGAFVAVGAAHLLGERGLLAELERRGHRVSRVGDGSQNPKFGLEAPQNASKNLTH